MTELTLVEIFTDGACRGNPGPGGWGAVLECDGRERELFGGEAGTTNNRMELMAVIEALSALKRPCRSVRNEAGTINIRSRIICDVKYLLPRISTLTTLKRSPLEITY